MLSLVVVLSVYYITSPEQQQNELAAVDETGQGRTEQGQEEQEKAQDQDKKQCRIKDRTENRTRARES